MKIEQIQKQADLVQEHIKGYLAALDWVAGTLKAEEKAQEEINALSVQKD